MTSLAIEQVLNPVSATTNLPVFRTEFLMVVQSIGFAERRSITSAETPFVDKVDSACKASTTRYDDATTVTSVPVLIIFALPNGVVCLPDGTSPTKSCNQRCSIITTGSGSNIASNNIPFASAAEVGIITFNPGI